MQKEKRKQFNDEEDDSSSPKRRKADLSKPVSFISTASMTEPESSRSRPQGGYDVFLSFRGEDTRKQFTDHLYSALIQAGIHTFRDDNELPRGEEISPHLLRAIEGSRISVVVFSKNYASSRWCLDELVKIIECRQKIHQVVLPIFYHTNPSDVRKQTGSYEKAFDKHEEHFKGEMEKVNRWREALTQAANLSGYGLNDTNGYEAEFIKKVVIDVACKLRNKPLHVAKHPVGISSRVQRVISLLTGARNNVGIVGIYGIAGIGKTTISLAVFNKLYFGFEGSSFLSGVKEISDKPTGLVKLQERLLHDILKLNISKISNVYEGKNLIKERLHRKKVLVVFDDVDNREQLDALMGERCWFGDGSKIIVVTKNKHLLTEVEVDGMYHAKELDLDQSLQLFSLHAFRETHPPKDYEELSQKVVYYCEGLPLALKILGSHLFGQDKNVWDIYIAHWQNIPHDDIQAKLRVSFDALDVDSREIFLDIACFFVGQYKDYVADIVVARYRCHPEVAFRTLIGRSLIRIDTENQNRLWMHDIVRKMGREIIRQRSGNHPEKCSRIVLPEDAPTVLSKETGTEAVEGLALDVQGPFSTKSFTKMRHLKLLQITGAHLTGSYSLLPRELIWLCWLECPLKSLPSDFHLSELLILDMQGSKVQKLWKGTKILNKLKILNLSYSKCLFETPNCLGLSSLERLILVDCTGLVKVHQSIGNLKSLVLLNLEGCNSLKSLPESMGSLKSLQTLNVTRCWQLEKLPESLGGLESLTELFAKGTGMKQLPTSARYLKKLTKLSFGGYKNVFYSPDPPSKSWFSRFSSWFSPKSCSSSIAMPLASFTGFSSLKELDLSYAGLSDAISSSDFGSLSFLEDLNLSGNGFFHLPSGISRLSKLMFLMVERCENLLSISELPPRGLHLYIGGCTSIERVSAPTELLCAKACRNLIEIQGMEFAGNNRSILSLDDCNNLSENTKMSLIQILNKLKILNLSYSKCLVKTPNFGGLPSLERLILVECTSLVEVHQSTGNLKSLVLLNLEKCYSLKSLPESMGSLKSLQTLNLEKCSQLEKLPDSLDGLESLTELFVKDTAIKQLPTSAKYSKKLTKLSFGGYKNVFCSPSKSRFSRFSSWFSSWLSPQSCSSSIAMRLDSFTSFTSLKKLDLRDAGLSDAISSIDFGSFSFLEDLNLSGNRLLKSKVDSRTAQENRSTDCEKEINRSTACNRSTAYKGKINRSTAWPCLRQTDAG